MNYLHGFARGIKAYGEAVQLLFTPRFIYFLLFPPLVVALLFVLGHYTVAFVGGTLSGMVEQRVMAWVADTSWIEWLPGTVAFIARLLARAVYYVLFLSFGGYIVLIVLSPVYSWLSERVETHLSGRKYPFRIGRLAREIGRGILISLRCMFFQFALTVLLFFLSFVPLVGLLVPLLTFGAAAYFYGFAFMDYAVERRYRRVGESVRYVRRNAGAVVALGAVFAFSLMLPFLWIFACGFVSLLSVIAGTIIVNETLNKNIEK